MYHSHLVPFSRGKMPYLWLKMAVSSYDEALEKAEKS